MTITSSYVGCRTFIYDENGDEIIKTHITEHGKDDMTITVKGAINPEKSDAPVTVLIISDEGIYEYSGRVRKFASSYMETKIGLFGGCEKKDTRESKRYPINMPASVKSLMINEEAIPLLNPLSVSVLNLSTSGALIKASADCFTKDSIIQMLVDINGHATNIYGRIVRVKEVDASTAEYGCQFVYAQ